MFINISIMIKLDEPSTAFVYKIHECSTKMFINVYKVTNCHAYRAKNVMNMNYNSK